MHRAVRPCTCSSSSSRHAAPQHGAIATTPQQRLRPQCHGHCEQQTPVQQSWHQQQQAARSCAPEHAWLLRPSLAPTAVASLLLSMQVLWCAGAGGAAELVERSSAEAGGNVPSELASAGSEQPPVALSTLMRGANKREVEGCTRKCVPTCIRGGLGPIALQREMVGGFKEGFRSRHYCLSECATACSHMAAASADKQAATAATQQQP